MGLDGKTVIITGAARGIGFATAQAFIARGANVAICDMGDNVYEAAGKLGKNAMGFVADVTKREQVAAFVAAVVEKFGTIDVLVNNAGITRDAQFLKMTDEMWDAVLTVNLKSMYIVTQEALKVMLEQGSGCVIGISSISGQQGNFGQANYAASKAGVEGFTRTLCREFAHKGIRANAVAPGFIITDMTAKMPEKSIERMLATIPMRRGGTTDEVGSVVCFLASEDASFINGQTIAINGGSYNA